MPRRSAPNGIPDRGEPSSLADFAVDQRQGQRTSVMCPLCDRLIPPAQADRHHLMPKSKGGRQTEFMHRICHRQIHALLTEGELARQYATVDALLQHPALQAFVAWVKTKPDDFFVRTHKSGRVRTRRGQQVR